MGNRTALLTALALAACAPAAADAPAASAPRQATAWVPDVPLATLDGAPSGLTEVAAGRVALVSLWATWCDACTAEMDALNRLHAKMQGRSDGVVIGVAEGEERDKVAAFTRRRGLRYAQLVDETFALSDALGQRRLPATLVLDRQGRIVFRGDALDERSLEALRIAMATP